MHLGDNEGSRAAPGALQQPRRLAGRRAFLHVPRSPRPQRILRPASGRKGAPAFIPRVVSVTPSGLPADLSIKPLGTEIIR